MKHPVFTVKLISFCLIAAALLIYGFAASSRARLVKENSEKAAEIRAYNEMIQRMSTEHNTNESDAESGHRYKDGTYSGSGQGFGGEINVTVTVKDDTITTVLIENAPGEDSVYLAQAEAVLESIITAQSTDIDTVSGATFSSKGIIEAVKAALRGAEE